MADQPDKPESIFLVQFSETVTYTHEYTRSELIAILSEDHLAQALSSSSTADDEAATATTATDEHLIAAVEGMASEGIADSLKEAMESYNDVQDNDDFTLTVAGTVPADEPDTQS